MFRFVGVAISAIFLLAAGSLTVKPPKASPTLTFVSPASGYIGTTITLTGTNFSLNNNVIYAGQKQSIWSGPSLDGQTMVLDILNTIQGGCYPGSQCRLWVENENGKSNAIDFTLADWILPETQVNITSPNMESIFRRGEGNTISWTGGHRVVALGLVREEATTDYDISSAGMIIGWINTKENQGYHYPNSSFVWDAMRVCDLNLGNGPDTNCHFVVQGSYKLIVWSQDPSGSMTIASGLGKLGKYSNRVFRGNWNLSPTFTISR